MDPRIYIAGAALLAAALLMAVLVIAGVRRRRHESARAAALRTQAPQPSVRSVRVAEPVPEAVVVLPSTVAPAAEVDADPAGAVEASTSVELYFGTESVELAENDAAFAKIHRYADELLGDLKASKRPAR